MDENQGNSEQITRFLDEQHAWTRDTIRRVGWAVQGVFGEEHLELPAFYYTIGLHERGHPELVVFGMSPETAAHALNDVCRRVIRGLDLLEGQLVLFDDWPHRMHVLPLPNPGDVLLTANRYYRLGPDESVQAMQLVWDDRHGRFPWEPDYSPPQWLQPLPGTFRA